MSNELLTKILERLDRIEKRLERIEKSTSPVKKEVPGYDPESPSISDLVKWYELACAEFNLEIQPGEVEMVKKLRTIYHKDIAGQIKNLGAYLKKSFPDQSYWKQKADPEPEPDADHETPPPPEPEPDPEFRRLDKNWKHSNPPPPDADQSSDPGTVKVGNYTFELKKPQII